MRAIAVFVFVALLASTHASEPAGVTSEKKSNTFTVDFPNTPIRAILEEIAKIEGLRVVIPNSLQGEATIKLRDATWRQIYQIVLQPAGWEYIEYDDHVQVLAKKDSDLLPWTERTIELLFQRPAEATKYLQKALAFTRLSAEASANTITVKVHPRHAKLVFEHVAKIDHPDVRLFKFPRKPHFPRAIPLPGEALAVRQTELPPTITINIDKGETVKGLLATTEIVTLRWVDCEDVKIVVEREVPDLFQIGSDVRSNALVLTGDQESITHARSIVEYLDDKRWYNSANREKSAAP